MSLWNTCQQNEKNKILPNTNDNLNFVSIMLKGYILLLEYKYYFISLSTARNTYTFHICDLAIKIYLL